MAECRRIPLTPFTGDTFVKPAPVQKVPDEPRDAVETVRLELTLFESGERSFPEFSYSQLLDNKIKLSKGDVPLSGFEEEEKKADEEATALARKYEEKYGGKAKKKDRIQDLIDIGYGYDEEDSFIDNSEAYDEFVPASITTKFGGFYVNSGVLHFRQASDTEDVPTGNTSDAFREKPKKKLCREDGDVKTSLDADNVLAEFVADEMRKKKKKKAAGPLSVAGMLREGQTMGVLTQRASPIVVVPATPPCPADAGGGGGSGLTDPLLSLIGSTNDHALIQAVSAVDFDIDLDSLLDVSEGSLGSQPAAEVLLFHPGAIDYPRPPNAGGALQLKPHPGQTQLLRHPSAHGCVPLPEGLPPGLERSIGRLAAAAKTSEGESKLKFFTPDINSILRDIELQCREHGGQLRSRVYTHLSSFLPCSRDTLLRRVKKLLDTHTHTEEPPDADDPLHKLKDAVGRAMPEQVALFQEKCQVYEQIRAAKATEEENGQEDNVEEKGGKRGGPKKLFKWNDEIRQCLFQVLRLKLQQSEKQKGSQELEEYLKTVLDNEVKPLWPKGWMQSRVLIRESRSVFNLLTSSPAKRSRPDRKPPSVAVRSDVCRTPPMRRLQDGAVVWTGTSDVVAASTSLDAAPLRHLEVKLAKPPSDEPVVAAVTAPMPSLLDLLADQALAREQPLSFSQELLAAAVTNYQRSMQRWSVFTDVSSPPLPPPPPQSSPVGFPLSAACPGGFPQVAQLARRQMTPDEADVTLQ